MDFITFLRFSLSFPSLFRARLYLNYTFKMDFCFHNLLFASQYSFAYQLNINLFIFCYLFTCSSFSAFIMLIYDINPYWLATNCVFMFMDL